MPIFVFKKMRDSKRVECNLRFGLELTILNLIVSFALAALVRQDGDSLRSDSQSFDALGPSFTLRYYGLRGIAYSVVLIST
jgi:hypothetical protein